MYFIINDILELELLIIVELVAITSIYYIYLQSYNKSQEYQYFNFHTSTKIQSKYTELTQHKIIIWI